MEKEVPALPRDKTERFTDIQHYTVAISEKKGTI